MHSARVVFVTGKGGVGKTTAAAALGQHAAAQGLRTLIIETANDGSLAQLFSFSKLSAAPQRLQPNLEAVCVEPRQLVEHYFTRILRFQWIADRLLSSNTFSALAAAAPGITEFLLLEKILGWIEPGYFGSRRRPFDLVVVDGPATGHALTLLRTPSNIVRMVPGGPIGGTASKLVELLGDRWRTQVMVVSLPEEMVVRETIEAYRALDLDLALHVTRPVINRVFPRHFTGAESRLVGDHNGGPAALQALLSAARFAIAARREAERYVSQLRRALGVSPILLRQLFAEDVHAADLKPFGRTLWKAVMGEAIVDPWAEMFAD